MIALTYAQAIATQTAAQIRDATLLPALAAAGSTVGGAPTSSPDRGIVEAESRFLAKEQELRAGVALSLSVTGAVAAGDDWVDAAATWFAVPNGTGGLGRIQATYAVWTVGLVVTAAGAPVTLRPGQVLQVQATDAANTIFNMSLAPGTPATLSAASSYKASVMFTARQSGIAGNVTPDQLRTGSIITSSVAGLTVDATFTPQQAGDGVARDPETSSALRDRCLASWARLGAAWTKQTFDYLIPLIGATFAVTRWLVDDSNPFGPGSVGVWLATTVGPASTAACAAVLAGLTSAPVKPIGSGPVQAQPTGAYADTVTVSVVGDGTNASLAVNVAAALTTLGRAFPVGPVWLTAALLEAVIMGGAFTSIAVTNPVSVLKEVPIVLPGFTGAVGISSLSTTGGLPTTGPGGAAADLVPYAAVLVLTPAVTVT